MKQGLSGVAHAGRAKAHLWVILGVEEGGRAQVLVALAAARVEAGGVDRQHHLELSAFVVLEPAVEALEVS